MDLNEEKSLELLMKEWEVDIQTQMHFNELIMKFRTAGLTIVGLFLSASVGALRFDRLLSICIGIAAIFLLIAFWILDFFYYFKLLIGAVNKTQEIDRIFSEEGMSLKIDEKRIRLFGLTKSITDEIDKEAVGRKYAKSKKLVTIYYGIMFLAGILILSILLGGGWSSKKAGSVTPAEKALNLAKNSRVIRTFWEEQDVLFAENSIQITLSHLKGDLEFNGWQIEKIQHDLFLLSNTFKRNDSIYGWWYEVDLKNNVVRDIVNDSLLAKKYRLGDEEIREVRELIDEAEKEAKTSLQKMNDEQTEALIAKVKKQYPMGRVLVRRYSNLSN